MSSVSTMLQPTLIVNRPPNTRDLMSWYRRVNAVDDPFWLLEEMKRGRVTKETVETVKHVYPNLFDQIEAAAQKAISTSTSPIDRKKMLTMSTIMGMSMGATTNPDFIKFTQSIHDEFGNGMQKPDSGASGSQPPARNADFAKGYEMPTDNLP